MLKLKVKRIRNSKRKNNRAHRSGKECFCSFWNALWNSYIWS